MLTSTLLGNKKKPVYQLFCCPKTNYDLKLYMLKIYRLYVQNYATNKQ